MWLLHLLPDEMLLLVVNITLTIGVIGSFFAFFVIDRVPALVPYKLLFQAVCATLLLFGIYFKGGYSVELEWRGKVAELETKLKKANEKSNQVNNIIQEKIIYKDRLIYQQGQQIIQQINSPAIQNFDKTCPLPQEVIDIHNRAVRMDLATGESKE